MYDIIIGSPNGGIYLFMFKCYISLAHIESSGSNASNSIYYLWATRLSCDCFALGLQYILYAPKADWS